MTYGEMKDAVKNLNDAELIDICENIYYWRQSGELHQESILSKTVRGWDFPDTRAVEIEALKEAHSRYKKLVLLLMKDTPSNYMK